MRALVVACLTCVVALPARSKGVAKRVDALVVQRLGWAACRAAHQAQASGFFELFKYRHRGMRTVVPDIGAQPLEHHRAQRRTAFAPVQDGILHSISHGRIAWPVIRDQRHMPDLHHEVGRDGGQPLLAGRRRATQAQRHAVRAVGMDDAAGCGIEAARCLIDALVQHDGLAGSIAAQGVELIIDMRQPRGIKSAQTGVGWRDEKAASLLRLKAHTDVACSGMDIAAGEQALANPADLFAQLILGHDAPWAGVERGSAIQSSWRAG